MLADGKYISYRVTHSIDRSLRSFFGIENKPQVILIKVESLVYCRPNYPGIIRRIFARNFRPCISAFDQSSLAIGIEVIADSVALKFIVLFQGYTREFRNVMSIKELKTLVVTVLQNDWRNLLSYTLLQIRHLLKRFKFIGRPCFDIRIQRGV